MERGGSRGGNCVTWIDGKPRRDARQRSRQRRLEHDGPSGSFTPIGGLPQQDPFTGLVGCEVEGVPSANEREQT